MPFLILSEFSWYLSFSQAWLVSIPVSHQMNRTSTMISTMALTMSTHTFIIENGYHWWATVASSEGAGRGIPEGPHSFKDVLYNTLPLLLALVSLSLGSLLGCCHYRYLFSWPGIGGEKCWLQLWSIRIILWSRVFWLLHLGYCLSISPPSLDHLAKS